LIELIKLALQNLSDDQIEELCRLIGDFFGFHEEGILVGKIIVILIEFSDLKTQSSA
jgi:hypothetical protein